MDVNQYYALGIPAYFLVLFAEYWLARRQGQRVYGFADTIGNLSGGLGEVVLGIFIGPLLVALYDFGFTHIALIHWPKDSLLVWIVAFFAADFCYYWYHRAGHAVNLFWAIHGVHHQSRNFNMSVAIRHPWLSDSYSFLFYFPLPLLGVPPFHFFLAISIISFYALAVHTRVLKWPSFFIFVTPQTHIVHHSKNPCYLNKNCGAMFSLWDRMFGTHTPVLPNFPPEIGSLRDIESYSGATAQLAFFQDMFDVMKQSKTWKEKLFTIFGPPGWKPQGVKLLPRQSRRLESQISRETQIYVVIQSLLLLLLSTHVLWMRDHYSAPHLIATSLAIVWSLFSLGSLLDGESSSEKKEGLRLSILLLCGLLLAISGRDYAFPALVAVSAAVMGVIWRSRLRLTEA